MKNIFCVFCLMVLVFAGTVFGQNPTGEWILQKIDDNFGSDNKITQGSMVIHGRRSSRTIKSKSWLQGMDQSFTEFLAPAREKGTKMLKLGDQLWTYSPSTDRTIRISGHLLRQSVMGSDMSYEDMMEDPKLTNIYEAKVAAEETFLDRPCWVLDLTAKKTDIAYYSRKIWVDKERFVALKENLFAKSGKLLKTTEVKEVKRIEDRWVPTHIVFKDVLKKGDGTEMVLESIEFNAEIPDHVFSKASLRK